MVIFRVYVNLPEGESQSHGGFHSHGDTLMAGWFFMETHENKWMMTGATPILGNSNMLVILWTYATIRITLGVQNMYQYVRDPVTKSTCSLRYVYVYGHLLVHIWGYRRVSNIEHCPPCGCSARHFRCRAGVSAWYYWLMHDNTGYVSLYISICNYYMLVSIYI